MYIVINIVISLFFFGGAHLAMTDTAYFLWYNTYDLSCTV